jgi:hypothetical protein
MNTYREIKEQGVNFSDGQNFISWSTKPIPKTGNE